MDLDEDVLVGRFITTTLDNIVRELKAEQGPEAVARSTSVESVILANLPTYEEFFNEQSSSEWESYSQSEKKYSLIMCAVDAAEVFAKAAMTKGMSRKEKKKIKEKAIGVTAEFKEYTQGRPFKASILPEVREKSAAAKKVESFRTGVREHLRSLAAFVSRKTGLKDAKKRDGDVENAGSLSLVVYSSTGPADSRWKSPDTDVSTSKRGRFSRFRAVLSRLCCCR